MNSQRFVNGGLFIYYDTSSKLSGSLTLRLCFVVVFHLSTISFRPLTIFLSLPRLFREIKTMSKTERLIEMVRSYPMLYDLSHEDYKSLRKKDRIWSEIGKELDENGE